MNERTSQSSSRRVKWVLCAWILISAGFSGCAAGQPFHNPFKSSANSNATISSDSNQGKSSSKQTDELSEIRLASYQEPMSEMPPEAPPSMVQEHDEYVQEIPMHTQGNQEPDNGWIEPAMPTRDQMYGQQIPSYHSDPNMMQSQTAQPMAQANGWGQSPQWQNQLRGGQANYGVNVRGSEFRIPNPTATELMIGLKDENVVLKNDIRGLNANIKGLNQELADERKTRFLLEEGLAEKARTEQKLREMVASLQVKVEDLEAEKLAAKQQFDNALREIESNLDAVLLNSLTPPSGGQASAGRVP